MSVITLPKENNGLGDIIQNMFAEFQRRKEVEGAAKARESEFTRTLGETQRLTDEQIRQNKLKAMNERAGLLVDDVLKTAAEYAGRGEHQKGVEFSTAQFKRIDDMLASTQDPDAAAMRDMVKDRLFAQLYAGPDTNVDATKRNTASTLKDITGRAADARGVVSPTSGATASDMFTTTKLGGAEMTAPVFGDVQQQGEGAQQHAKYADVIGGLSPDANAQLQAETSRQNQRDSNATQVRVAGMNIDAENAAAARKVESQGATDAVTSLRKGAEAASEIHRLSTEILNDKSFSGAFGVKNQFAQPLWKDEPIAGTPEAAIHAKVNQIKALVTIPQMQVMKGLGSQSDAEFKNIQNSVTTLGGGLSESDAKAELSRLGANAAALTSRYERLKETADKHFGGDIIAAAKYVREHGGNL